MAIKRLTKLSKDSQISIQNIVNIGNGGVVNWVPDDFNAAINEARNQFSDSIGAPVFLMLNGKILVDWILLKMRSWIQLICH